MSIRRPLAALRKKYRYHREWSICRTVLARNATLYQTKSGQTGFILGNGPSINQLDLARLAGRDTFVMNSFWRHPQYQLLRPTYYLAVSLPHGLEAPGTVSWWGQDLPGGDRVISQVPETKLFFAAAAQSYIENHKLFASNPKYYLLQQGQMDQRLRFNLDPTKPLPFSKNSLPLALMLAVYLGYETIYLFGCEHDFLAHPHRQAFTDFKHFYSEPGGAIPVEWQNSTYEDALHGTLKLFRNYRWLKEKLARNYSRVKIFNATPNSFLDVFPAIEPAQIKW